MCLLLGAVLGPACLLGASLVLAQTGMPAGPQTNRTAAQPRAPAASGSEAQDGTVLADIPPYGFVRDTPEALAALMRPLAPAPGRNDLVEACRALVEKSAEEQGAARVEAVSAGPQRRVRNGYVARVRFRILYPGFLRSQVRQATLICRADRNGRVFDAQP